MPSPHEPSGYRILIDCTETARLRASTGIQRAVRSIVGVTARFREDGVECIPIQFDGNRFVRRVHNDLPAPTAGAKAAPTLRERVRRFVIGASRFGALRATVLHPAVQSLARQAASSGYWRARRYRARRASPSPALEYTKADWILLLDSTWGPDLRQELGRARSAGARVCVVIYDLIQVRHPDLVSPGAAAIYRRWLERVLPFADRIVTISKSVRDDVRRYLDEAGYEALPDERLGWFHLGCDFDRPGSAVGATADTLAMFAEGHPRSFLVVGTLEQRKSQATVLDAFERLWKRGDASRLVLVGREGLGNHALTRRLRRHPERGHRLVWLQDASDADLEVCYRNAAALINASSSEGFGLPIVEALHRGIAVIASDIPVFREVGGSEVVYVPPGDVEAWAAAIEAIERAPARHAPSAPRYARSWAEATRALIGQLIDDKTWSKS
jgi:glycosyltransferase involved in cell wall biosynthesis